MKMTELLAIFTAIFMIIWTLTGSIKYVNTAIDAGYQPEKIPFTKRWALFAVLCGPMAMIVAFISYGYRFSIPLFRKWTNNVNIVDWLNGK
jgi:TRAP-type C4-dicarboxylate transport system permease small subunit